MAGNKDGEFWNGGEKPKPGEQSVWENAQKAKSRAQADARDPGAVAERKKSRKLRFILISGGVVVVGGALLLALAPTIAGAIAPGIIEGQASKHISGEAKVASVSLSWTGPQRIEGLQLLDKGKEVVAASLSVDAGLFSLIRGNLNLGEVVVDRASVKIVREQGGELNLQRLLASPNAAAPGAPSGGSSSGSKSEARVPEGLKAAINVKNLKVQYTDRSTASGADVSISDLDIKADIEPGTPLTLKAKGKASNAADPSRNGGLAADIKIEKWSKEDGELTIKKAKSTSTIEISDLPVALLEAFVPAAPGQPAPALAKGLGDSLSLSIDVQGTMGDLAAKTMLTTSGARASADIKWADGAITAAAPIEAMLSGKAIWELVPSIRKSLDGQDAAKISALPDVTFGIESLNLPFEQGQPIDLRGGGAKITLATTATRGTLKLAPDRPSQPFELSPLNVTVDSADLAKGLTVAARTDLAIEGTRAGEVTIDATCGGLLDKVGVPVGGIPPGLRGSVLVRNIATAILQPFVQSTGMDLAADIGPTLDVQVTAQADTTSGDSVPPTDLVLKVTSRELTADAQLSLLKEGIETKADGVRVDIASAGRIASRFVKPETGWALSATDGGKATLVVRGLALPKAADGSRYLMEQLRTQTVLTLEGITARALNANSDPVRIDRLNISTDAQNGTVQLAVRADAMLGQRGFDVQCSADIPGMIVAPRAVEGGGTTFLADFASVKPVGSLALSNVPVEIAGLFAKPAPEGEKAMDLPSLLKGTMGPTFTVTVNSQPVEGGAGYDFGVNAQAERMTAGVSARVDKTQVALKSASVKSSLNEQAVQAILREFAPGITGAPKLLGVTQVELGVSPITVPLDSTSKPVWHQAGTASVSIEAKGRTIVDGLQMTDAQGVSKPLGRVGVDGLKLTATSPMAIIMGTGQPGARTATVTMSGKVIGPADTELCALAINAGAELEAAKPAGPATVSVKLTGLDTRQLEGVLGQDGLYSGALGARASLDIDAKLTPPIGSRGAFDVNAATIDVTTNFQAANLETNGPLKAVISPASIAIKEPAKFTLRVDPQIANTLLQSKPKPGEPAPSASSQLTMTAPATFSLTIDSFTLPRTKDAKFAVKTSLQSAGLNLRDGDGRAVKLSGLNIRAATEDGKASPPLTFLIEAASAGVAEYTTTQPLRLMGKLENVINAQGAFDVKKGTLSMGGDLKGIPTALVDAFAKKEGMLVDALGPTVDVFVEAEKVPMEGLQGRGGPTIKVRATSARATANVIGGVSENVFTSQGPVTVSVLEVTKALAARYIGSVPVVESIEKLQSQRPATITANDLKVPLNNDMSKLNGKVVLDPGELNFQMSEGFGKLVGDKFLKQKGVLGQKLQPVNVAFTDGVGALQRYDLPLGEFTLAVEGEVDLVREQVDIVTWIPATLLADETIGSLAGLLPGGSNPLLSMGDFTAAIREFVPMVPYRTKGPMNSPKSSLVPDGQLLLREFERNGGWQKLLQRLLQKRIGDQFKLPDGLIKPNVPKTPPPK